MWAAIRRLRYGWYVWLVFVVFAFAWYALVDSIPQSMTKRIGLTVGSEIEFSVVYPLETRLRFALTYPQASAARLLPDQSDANFVQIDHAGDGIKIRVTRKPNGQEQRFELLPVASWTNFGFLFTPLVDDGDPLKFWLNPWPTTPAGRATLRVEVVEAPAGLARTTARITLLSPIDLKRPTPEYAFLSDVISLVVFVIVLFAGAVMLLFIGAFLPDLKPSTPPD